MSGAITAVAVGAVGGMLLSKAMAPKMPDAPKLPEVKPPPQAAAMPDQQATRANAASQSGGYGPGAGSTMLTGGGVDPNSLLLGKNKLLGQ